MAESLVERVMLGEERPLLPLAVERLLALAGEDLPRDLSALLVLVPTAQAGRRLREELALAAGDAGVLAPRVRTPEQFWQDVLPRGAASDMQCLLAWRQVLMAGELGRVFAGEDVLEGELDSARALQLGRQLLELRRELADGAGGRGIGFEEFVDELDGGSERERALVGLEREFLDVLASWGCGDPHRWQGEGAEAGAGFDWARGLERVLLVGVVDAAPRVLRVLELWARAGGKVESWVAGGERWAGCLDGWGRPDLEGGAASFAGRLGLDWDGVRMMACADAEVMAQRCVGVLAQWGVASDEVSVGAVDGAFGGTLAGGLSQAGWVCFDPQGMRAGVASGVVLVRFLTAVLGGSCEGFLEFVAVKGVEGMLASLRGVGRGQVEGMARLLNSGLPQDLASLRALAVDARDAPEGACWRPRNGQDVAAVLVKVVDELMDWRGRMQRADSVGMMVAELAQDLSAVDDGADGNWWVLLRDTGLALARLEASGARFGAAEGLDLVLAVMGSTLVEAETEGVALELSGWLELGFVGTPYVVLAGLHEGVVPAQAKEGPLIHDGVRERLGLRGREWRYAVDVLRMAQLLCARRPQDVVVLVAEQSPAGDGCLPSRLLLTGEGEGLVERVRLLMQEQEVAVAAVPAWDRGRMLLDLGRPEGEDLLPWGRALSPSKINRYLQCPLRFALENIWRMRREEVLEGEMDQRGFGNLAHWVLEDFGKDEQAREFTQARAIADFLQARLDVWMKRVFGGRWGLTLRLQRDSLANRLGEFARWQATWRSAGWRVAEAEYAFGFGQEWLIGGLPVSGVGDRIDRHEETGEWMIWDYKTRAKPRGKWDKGDGLVGALDDDVHLAPRKEGACYVGDALVPFSSRQRVERIWLDLQLPLYALRWQQLCGGGMPRVGQISLGVSLADVAGYEWMRWADEEHGARLQESALKWAEGAVKAIRAGRFWPVGPHWKYQDDAFGMLAQDDWEGLFTLESRRLLGGAE